MTDYDLISSMTASRVIHFLREKCLVCDAQDSKDKVRVCDGQLQKSGECYRALPDRFCPVLQCHRFSY
jgi:hypothetical protein